MKNTKIFFYYLLVSALLTAISISCNKSTVTGIKLDKDELILAIGGTATLTANLLPYSSSDKVSWTTSNSDVAVVECDDKVVSVSKSTVTGKSTGTAIITITTKSGKHVAQCTVTVINPEPELISVESGTFAMGCTDDDCSEDNLPVHQVTLSSYKIAKNLVTQQQWEAVMGRNPSHFKGHNLPVEKVNWYTVQEFIQKLNALTGKNYRLPTEAEWEYAARGGNKSKGYKYSGSDDINAVAWYVNNSERITHPVGTKAPNELGIYDMSGNLFEWCSDWSGAYTEAPQTNPAGPASGTLRIIRGGSISVDEYFCRVSFRMDFPPDADGGIGLRLVHP